jgi:hypothetical protein
MRLQFTHIIKYERYAKFFKISSEICTAILAHRFNSRGCWSVCQLNCCWSSPALILGFSSRRDPWPRICSLLDIYAFRSGASSSTRWGVGHRKTATFVALDWLLNCCWPSSAQWFLVPSPTGFMTIFYCLTGLGTFQIRSEYSLCPYILAEYGVYFAFLWVVLLGQRCERKMFYIYRIYRYLVIVTASTWAMTRVSVCKRFSTIILSPLIHTSKTGVNSILRYFNELPLMMLRLFTLRLTVKFNTSLLIRVLDVGVWFAAHSVDVHTKYSELSDCLPCALCRVECELSSNRYEMAAHTSELQ